MITVRKMVRKKLVTPFLKKGNFVTALETDLVGCLEATFGTDFVDCLEADQKTWLSKELKSG
jgi:hypothetical protein